MNPPPQAPPTEQSAPEQSAETRFLATVSHEIRTPLNGILGLTALLEETVLAPAQREYVRAIRDSGSRLLELLNNVLDYARMDARALQLEAVALDPAAIGQEVVELLAPHAHARGLDLACVAFPDAPRRVAGDPGRLRQILLNLTGNAIKFTRAGAVLVSIEAGALGWALVVRDTGPGLTPEAQARCFAAFSQTEASDAQRDGGVGLGLAIVRTLVDAMGGQVSVQSDGRAGAGASTGPGPGAAFRVDLPLNPLTAVAETPAVPPAPPHDLPAAVHAVGIGPASLLALAGSLGAAGVSVYVAAEPDTPGAVVLRGADAPAASHPASPPVRRVVVLRPEDRAMIPRWTAEGAAGFLLRPLRPESVLRRVAAAATEEPPETGADLPPEAPQTPATAPAPEVGSRRALVADDNPVNALLARRTLESLGWAVEVATNGLDAVEAAHRTAFDLIVMDVRMPVMDGLTAIGRIRADGLSAGAGIIAASAHLDGTVEAAARAAGADRSALKPLDPHRLRAMAAELGRPADAPTSTAPREPAA